MYEIIQLKEIDIKIASALYKLGLLNSDDIVKLSLIWIENDIDSNEIGYLAGVRNPDLFHVGPIFETALDNLTEKNYTNDEALIIVTKFYLELVFNEKLDPEYGLSLILSLYYGDEPTILNFEYKLYNAIFEFDTLIGYYEKYYI